MRWGVLGTARINEKVLPLLQESKRHQVLAIGSRSKGKAEEVALAFGIEKFYESYDEVLEDKNVDAIYISLPNSLHVEWVKKALKKGKHVLCEKPMCFSGVEASQISELAKVMGLHVAEAFMYRHHLQTKKVLSLVENGVLGKLKEIRGEFHFELSQDSYGNNIRWNKELGGGVLYDLGCYLVNYIIALTGSLPINLEVSSLQRCNDVDVAMTVTMKFANSMVAILSCSFLKPRQEGLELIGDNSRMHVTKPFKPSDHELLLVQPYDLMAPSEEILINDSLSPYLTQFNDFEDVVNEIAKPVVSLAESIANAKIMEDITKFIVRN